MGPKTMIRRLNRSKSEKVAEFFAWLLPWFCDINRAEVVLDFDTNRIGDMDDEDLQKRP